MLKTVWVAIDINQNHHNNSALVQQCVDIIYQRLEDDEFDVPTLANMVHLSKQTLYRKIKKITGLDVRNFIRDTKMKIAYEMLLTGNYNVSEVAWRCGYSNSRHFSKIFFEHFQQYPSQVGKEMQ